MTFSQSTYHSKTYRRFKEIDTGDHRGLARFFEKNERTIRQLDFPEYFELHVCYASALFEIGAYERHLQQVDFILESTIAHNIQLFQGEDLFCKTLFQKAASHFNLLDYQKAEYLLRELIRINPYYPDADAFLQKTIYQQRPTFVRNTRAVAIALFLLAAFLIAVEVIFIRNLYPTHTVFMEYLRTAVFIGGLLVLVIGDCWLRWKIRTKVHSFIQASKTKRRRLRE
ncbi:MAG: hypothetical protein AAF738_05135 [Bacteroidota bacterium]